LKPSKKIWLLLGVVIFAIAAVFLFQRYSSELSQQENLGSDLSKAQSAANGLLRRESTQQSQLAELESQLAEAISERDATEASFPVLIESIEYGQVFFGLADAHNLKITSIRAGESRSQREGDSELAVTYAVTSFVLDVEGRVPELIFTTSQGHKEYLDQTVGNIVSFIEKLASSEDFAFATVKQVNITVPEPLSEIDLYNWRRQTQEDLTRQFLTPEMRAGEAETERLLLEQEITTLVQLMLPVEIKAVLEGRSEASLGGMSWLSPALPAEMSWGTRLRVNKASATIEVNIYSLSG